MKLTYTFEKFTNKHQLQVIEISATANSIEEAENLGYDDFEINLYINHVFVADISPVIAKTGVLTDLIDGVDWVELFKEQKIAA